MKTNDHPQGHVLQAYFDTELSEAEAIAVGEHCNGCLECRTVLAELDAVGQYLTDDRSGVVPEPVWPHVAARLRRERNRRLSPVFAFGTVAACAAGIVLGLLVGTPAGDTIGDTSATTWAAAGLFSSDSGSTSLLDIYSDAETKARSEEP